MNIKNKKIKISICFALLFGFFPHFIKEAKGANTQWEWKYYSKSMFENADKDYFLETFDLNSGLELLTPTQDRTSYFSGYWDIFFKMSNDLSSRTVLDFSDSLRAQYYNLEDYNPIDEDSYKYRYVNNLFLATLGHSFDEKHSVKIDLEHSYYQLPVARELDSNTVRGNIDFTKNFTDNFSGSLGFEGKFGRYPNEITDDFDEGSIQANLYHFFPEIVKKVDVIPATRFNGGKLSQDPTGFNYELVYDYNSEFSEERMYEDRPEIYKTELVRGDFFLTANGDWDSRRLTNSTGESYLRGGYTLSGGYNISDTSTLRFSDIYVDKNYEAESELLLNFSSISNTFNANYSASIGDTFNFYLTYNTSYYLHKNFTNQDYTLKTTILEFDYHPNRLNYYLSLSFEDKDYKEERLFYPSHFKKFANFILSYKLTDSILFKFRDDYSDFDYGIFEDKVYSSLKQNIYTVSIDVALGRNHNLEAGYYFLKEDNKRFRANDTTERTLFFNWQLTY